MVYNLLYFSEKLYKWVVLSYFLHTTRHPLEARGEVTSILQTKCQLKSLFQKLDKFKIFFFCAESTGKVAVLVGQGGVAGGKSLGAAVAMLGKDGDYFTPGTQGVIRFNQISKTRYIFL